MSSFPGLSALRALCFPGDSADTSVLQSLGDLITKRVLTRPRKTATTFRHPENQSGLVLEEDGTAVLRAGHELYDHSVGATLSLRPDGTLVITAPAGLLLSGPLFTSDSPTDALHMGGFQFSPVWEMLQVVNVLNPLLLDTVYVAPGPGMPAVIPLGTILQGAPLYQTPENLLG